MSSRNCASFDRLLRDVAVASDQEAVREGELIQVGRSVDAIVESRILVRKLVDDVLIDNPRFVDQEVIERV